MNAALIPIQWCDPRSSQPWSSESTFQDMQASSEVVRGERRNGFRTGDHDPSWKYAANTPCQCGMRANTFVPTECAVVSVYVVRAADSRRRKRTVAPQSSRVRQGERLGRLFLLDCGHVVRARLITGQGTSSDTGPRRDSEKVKDSPSRPRRGPGVRPVRHRGDEVDLKISPRFVLFSPHTSKVHAADDGGGAFRGAYQHCGQVPAPKAPCCLLTEGALTHNGSAQPSTTH